MKNYISGHTVNQGHYKCFQPTKINRAWLIEDMELINLLSKADRQLGRLDMYSEYIPNIDLFISMHIVKEATKSSKIEGTKTNIEEALQERVNINVEKRDDWEEVQNYIKALTHAIRRLEEIPFSSRLIRESHRILLEGVRGKYKMPGEFRTSQNWIGGATIDDAKFIPPGHASVNDLMGDLENFAHNDTNPLPHLLRIALIHYQFETIHPFLDGNGRVGRLLITLYLVEKQILKKPILYLSDFFEKNRELYYDNLMAVRQKNDLVQWFKFFLVGVLETAKNSINTFDNILKLKSEVDDAMKELGARYNNAQTLINSMFKNPFMSPSRAQGIIDQTPPSVYSLLKEMERLEVIKEISGNKRGKLYVFQRYLDLFK